MEDEAPVEDSFANFNMEVVKELMNLGFAEPDKIKVNKDALTLVAKVLQIFVAECALRTGDQARITHDGTVDVEHLEKILPQLLFDF